MAVAAAHSMAVLETKGDQQRLKHASKTILNKWSADYTTKDEVPVHIDTATIFHKKNLLTERDRKNYYSQHKSITIERYIETTDSQLGDFFPELKSGVVHKLCQLCLDVPKL